MGPIIDGASLGSYVTVAIEIGQSSKENRNGVKSKYIALSVKNKKSLICKTRKVLLFEDDVPGFIEILKEFCPAEKNARGRYVVNIAELKKSENFASVAGLMEFEGAMIAPYKLRKGECYANDDSGQLITDGSGQKVQRSTIEVLVQVDKIIPNEQGTMTTVYVDGWSPDAQGSRIESAFWRTPVEAAPATVTSVTDAGAGDASTQSPDDPF